jgi:hypothetical protein
MNLNSIHIQAIRHCIEMVKNKPIDDCILHTQLIGLDIEKGYRIAHIYHREVIEGVMLFGMKNILSALYYLRGETELAAMNLRLYELEVEKLNDSHF